MSSIKYIIIVLFLALVVLGTWTNVSAQATTGNATYTLLTPLPNGTPTGQTTVPTNSPVDYINLLYRLFVSLAIVLAVFMIVLGGFTIMSTDNIENKSEGKKYISQAIWGLTLLLASYLILNTINPDILNFGKVFKDTISTPASNNPPQTVTSGGTGSNTQ